MSGRKNNLLQFNTINNVSMSVSSITSAVTDIQFLDDVGIQFTWTGSPTGSFAVQVSANHKQDLNGNVQTAGNWVPLTFTYWDGAMFVTAQSVPTSAGSPIYLDMALLSAPYIRCVYTGTPAVGTLTATITAKEI